MNFVELIAREVAKLPSEVQAEVLDFVNFLVNKYTPKIDDQDQAFEQFSQHRALAGKAPDEETANPAEIPHQKDWR